MGRRRRKGAEAPSGLAGTPWDASVSVFRDYLLQQGPIPGDRRPIAALTVGREGILRTQARIRHAMLVAEDFYPEFPLGKEHSRSQLLSLAEDAEACWAAIPVLDKLKAQTPQACHDELGRRELHEQLPTDGLAYFLRMIGAGDPSVVMRPKKMSDRRVDSVEGLRAEPWLAGVPNNPVKAGPKWERPDWQSDAAKCAHITIRATYRVVAGARGLKAEDLPPEVQERDPPGSWSQPRPEAVERLCREWTAKNMDRWAWRFVGEILAELKRGFEIWDRPLAMKGESFEDAKTRSAPLPMTWKAWSVARRELELIRGPIAQFVRAVTQHIDPTEVGRVLGGRSDWQPTVDEDPAALWCDLLEYDGMLHIGLPEPVRSPYAPMKLPAEVKAAGIKMSAECFLMVTPRLRPWRRAMLKAAIREAARDGRVLRWWQDGTPVEVT